MQGGPTPAGETSPLNLSDIPCVPDIQQTTNNSNNNIRGNNNISNIAPDITEISSSELPSDDQNLQVKGNRVASLLLVSHIVEIIAMILVILLRFIPEEIKHSANSPTLLSENTLPSNFDGEEISPVLLWLHVGILIVPLKIVTTISLNWVLRVQDFSGKIVARLVCWILHLFQSSLVWRFLKLQIAYDPGDLTELGMLRFIQLHIHILPFLVMHIAITLTYPRSLGIALSLGLALLLSVVTTITVSTVIRQNGSPSALVPSTITQMYHLTLNKANTHTSLKNDDSKSHIVIGATTMCLLWSRIISMATLFCLHAIWAICLIILHWAFAVIWLCFQKDTNSSVISSARLIIRRSFLGFLLLWDWHVLETNDSSPNVCAQPQLPVIYYIIVASQNIAATSAWYFTKQIQGISILYTIVLTSVIVSQIFALLFLSLSYMCYSPDVLRWSNKKHSLTLYRKPSSLVTPTAKANSTDATPKMSPKTNIDLAGKSTSHINLEEFVEDTGNFKQSSAICRNPDEKVAKQLEVQSHNKDKKNKNYQIQLTPRLLSNHLNSSMFSYANDILQHTSKSEISSTDNGSFNSRNTNTLPTSGALIPDFETDHRPHGSFSDSFSSLSCGTVNKVMTSTPKGNISSNLYISNLKRMKHRKSCQKSCCQVNLLDQLSRKCTGLKEEQDEISTGENQPHDQASFISLEKEVSPPRVALVRATQRFQVVCTKCLYAHDPLLTKCRISQLTNGPPSLSYSCGGELGALGGSSSTGYPSDTEITTTVDTLSSVSADSHSTYTTWPVGKGPGLAKLLMREKGGHEYVTAWLRHQQNDSQPPNEMNKRSTRKNNNNPYRENISKGFRPQRRNGHRSRLRSSPAFIQDLETVV